MLKKKESSGKSKVAFNKRTLLIILCVVLAAVLVVLIVGTAYMEKLMNLIGRDQGDDTLSPSEQEEFLNAGTETMPSDFEGDILNPDDVEWNQHEGPVVDAEHIINIMLIGQDRRPGEKRANSDVMILCSINKLTKELTMTSFMRDMYVPIPGFYDYKMNASYLLGGMETLDACLKENFGVHVDGNVEVDFNGFIGVIDLVGGVEMELTAAEAKYLNNEYGLQETSGSFGWDLKEGKNQLTGGQALAYARIRAVGDGDFGRTERQRKVIAALVEKCKDMNLTQLKNLMVEVLPLLTTDLTNREILNYIIDLLPVLSNLKVNTQRIPADGTYRYAWIKDMSVLLPDLEENRELLKHCIVEE